MSDDHATDRGQPSKSAWNFRPLLCLGLGVLVGWLGWKLHLPLSWLLGPLVVTAIFSIAGAPVFAPLYGRRLGQLLIGASVGLQLTAPVLTSLVEWFPVMAAMAIGSILLASFLSSGFATIEKLDRKTAFFATIPGGLSEMANIAVKAGGRPEPVVVTQTFRVALVVFMIPPLLMLFAEDVDLTAWSEVTAVPYQWLPVVIATGAVGAVVLRGVRFQNPWMLGSLLAVAGLAATGVVDGRMPPSLIVLAQILLGIVIGARFKGDILHRLARLCLVGALFTVVLTIAIACVVASLAATFDFDFASVMLGAAPGGFAEMVVTSQVLHLNVALVTGFHIIRSLIINGLAPQIFEILNKLKFFAGGERLFGIVFRR